MTSSREEVGRKVGKPKLSTQVFDIIGCVAETEGFEPSVPDLPVRRFIKPLVSATHPRLLCAWHRRPIAAHAFGCNVY